MRTLGELALQKRGSPEEEMLWRRQMRSFSWLRRITISEPARGSCQLDKRLDSARAESEGKRKTRTNASRQSICEGGTGSGSTYDSSYPDVVFESRIDACANGGVPNEQQWQSDTAFWSSFLT